MDQKAKTAALIVILGVLYSGYELWGFLGEGLPQLIQTRQSLEVQLTEKEGEYNRLKQFVANIEGIKSELRELGVQLKSALEYMPPEYRMQELLRRLTALAQNSGVELIRFDPATEENRSTGAFFATIPISFEVRGAFTQILLFFDQVSRLKRIISLAGVEFALSQETRAVADDRTERLGPARIFARGTYITYRFVAE